jgi:asparagine synthase (glutamine-hydrolysing)
MCGISVILKEYTKDENLTLSHRGPDEHNEDDFSGWRWVFDRLAINGIDDGQQPFKCDESRFVCNGEIYNHKSLCALHNIVSTTGSDCEVVFKLLNDVCEDDESLLHACRSIDGEYAFVHKKKCRMIVSRDRFGVRPLYYGLLDNRIIGFASEAKGLAAADKIEQFPPGEVWVLKDGANDPSAFSYPVGSIRL